MAIAQAAHPQEKTLAPSSRSRDPQSHPALRRLRILLRAFDNGNERTAAATLDYPHWWKSEHVEDTRIWELLPAQEQSEFQAQVHQRIAGLIPLLRENVSVEMGFPEEGELLLIRFSGQTGHWQIACHEREGTWWLSSIQYVEGPKEVETEKNSDDASVPLEEQAAGATDGVFVSTGDGGKLLAGTVEPVESAPGLTPELRSQIHAWIVLALAEQGLESRLAREELQVKVQLAVPELLNRLVDLPLDGSREREEEVAALDGLLQRVTFRRSSFPSRALDGNPDNLALRQKLSIAAWFPWWKQWRRRWGEWEKKAGIPTPDPRRRRGRRG